MFKEIFPGLNEENDREYPDDGQDDHPDQLPNKSGFVVKMVEAVQAETRKGKLTIKKISRFNW